MVVEKNILNQLISNPDEDFVEIQSLESLCNSHPYSSIFHTLLAYKYYLTDNPNYQKQLKKASISSSNREGLYNLFFSEFSYKQIKTHEETLEEIPKSQELKRTHENQLKELILSSAIGSTIELETDETANKIEKKADNPSIIDDKKMSFTNWMSHFSGRKENTGKALIDEFISSNPAITPNKAEFYSPSSHAKRSIEEDPELVTETLAKIYASQGNLEKAIESYHKLTAKYPEKSTFFAARIKELENK